MDYSFFNPPQQQFQFYGLSSLPPSGRRLEESTISHPGPFDSTFVPFDSNGFNPSFATPHQRTPPESFTTNSPVNTLENDSHASSSLERPRHDSTDAASGLNFNDLQRDRRSDSEEKDLTLTPAQTRRKEQNRAAQRAFRERKERHVRDLEQKLSDLEQASNTLHADNERLRQELAKVATENEILRATSQVRAGGSVDHQEDEPSNEQEFSATTEPIRFSPIDFHASVLSGHGERHMNPTHRIIFNQETGERLLDAAATWDYIQNHRLFKQGLVDIAAVADRLKPHAQCDGQGPVFEEKQIQKILEESVVGSRDELI